MKKTVQVEKNQFKIAVWVVYLSLFFLIYFLASIYCWALKPTDESYSFVQNWKQYYSLENWNYPHYRIIDIDNDGKNDFIETSGCVFLSSVKSDAIDTNSQCSYSRHLTLVGVSNGTLKKGQYAVNKKKLSELRVLTVSYLTQTFNGTWKLYYSTGFNISVFQLEKNGLFREQNPTLWDIIDAYTYQLAHLGIVISMAYFACFIVCILIYKFRKGLKIFGTKKI